MVLVLSGVFGYRISSFQTARHQSNLEKKARLLVLNKRNCFWVVLTKSCEEKNGLPVRNSVSISNARSIKLIEISNETSVNLTPWELRRQRLG
jgi:hypothetical protein